jgi:hypothetical protein
VCACGKEKMVRYLLENGADPTIKDKTGRDALKIAQHFGNYGKVFEEFKRNSLLMESSLKLKKEVEEMKKMLTQSQKEWSIKQNGWEEEKRTLANKLAFATKEYENAKNISDELKIRLDLKDQDMKGLTTLVGQFTSQMEQLSQGIATKEKQIAAQDQEIKKLSGEKDVMKTLIEQYTQHMQSSIQTISFSEKKIGDLCEEIEELKMKNKSATLDDFATLLRDNLSEINSCLEYHVNFDEMCSKPLASLSRETRFLEDLSKDISEQVLKVVEGNVDVKKNIETCVVKREQKRSDIIQIIQNLKISLKQEQDKITSIQHLLIFDNKLDSKKVDALCSMRSKLMEMDKELELRLLTIPKHFEECNHKIGKILQVKKELEEKDQELDKLEGNIKTQFKKNSPDYKSQMNKLEIQRNAWKQEAVKLEIAKQVMVNGLIHYPELRFKLEDEEESFDDPFKNYLKSVNLLVDLNFRDHFPTRDNFKGSLHLLNCTNLQGEPKFLKKLVISDPKTVNEVQLLMLFNHPHIIKPELAFIDDGEVYLQFPFFEQIDVFQDPSNSLPYSLQVCDASRHQI